MQWASLWSYYGAHNNIKTWLCLSDIKWLRCWFVNLLPYKETQNCCFFFSFLFFCFLQKKGKLCATLFHFKQWNKVYLKLGWYQLGNYDYICLRQHINVAYVWQIYCRKLSHLWLSGEILLVAISIYNRLQDKEEMSGYTNTPQSGIILKPVFLTDYKACIFYFVLCLRLCLHRSRVLVK